MSKADKSKGQKALAPLDSIDFEIRAGAAVPVAVNSTPLKGEVPKTISGGTGDTDPAEAKGTIRDRVLGAADAFSAPYGSTLGQQGLAMLDAAHAEAAAKLTQLGGSGPLKAEEFATEPLVTDVLGTTADWFVATGQMPEEPTPNVRQTAFYLGMQLEELAEKLECVLGVHNRVVALMHAEGRDFKNGKMDGMVGSALQNNALAFLDGDMDLIWVSIGAARAQGADVIGAYSAVNHANWAKEWEDGTFHKNENGKVIKPEGWLTPDLLPYIHKSLSGL